MRRISLFALSITPLLACVSDGGDRQLTGDTADAATTLATASDTLSSDSTTDDTSTADASTDDDTGESGGLKLDTLPAETADDGPDPEDCIEDVDIVFVMDVSTTMGPFFDKLESDILAVHDALAAFDLPNPPHYGLAVFVDDFTLVNAGAPYTDINALKADFEYWNNFTSSNQQTGGGSFNSTWTENSLDALFAASGGFQWRPVSSTLRMIIHTTDDTFWNGPTVANGVNILHDYPETVSSLQQREIRMFTFADHLGGQSGTDDVSEGFFTDYAGQAPIPAQTGGAAYEIGQVLAGVISLSDAIVGAVEESYCEEYPPIG
ncbi:VWA domain-containing protein [Enhygromyxa salina]|uniref:VWFA domain-containing protein n=1 Tax=Enhygromyxa salina TaxID=215803 RepID=A0A2S9YJ84_9BACT|nr:VWA domain-containing protein [Enhygromyxa salina]PRQ05102.1 hypothetical protein ENSA7_47310 [Enhygromyxa salina]